MRSRRVPRIYPPRPLGYPNPFEAYLLVVGALQGGAVLTGIAQSAVLRAALPPVMLLVWATLLAAGGVLGVVGLYWPRSPFTGIEIKRVGLGFAGVATLAYGVALASAGQTGYIPALANLGFAAACAARIGQATKAIGAARRHVEDLHTVADRWRRRRRRG